MYMYMADSQLGATHLVGYLTIIEWGWVRYGELSRPRFMLSAEAKLRRITQTEALIILHITRKPNSIIVLLLIERIKTNIWKQTKIHQIFNLF